MSAWVWVADAAFSMVPACPKPSEAPNPAMVWNVDAPLMLAVSAAAAGPAGPRAVKALTPSNVTEAISDTPIVRLVGVNTVLLNTGPMNTGPFLSWSRGVLDTGGHRLRVVPYSFLPCAL